jgi:hypothetical protein
VDCADCRAWRAPRFGNTLPVSAHEIAANRPSETCDAHHRWRTPSLEHNGRPRLANIGHCAKYGRHGVLCALIQPLFSGINHDGGAISPPWIVARKTTAVGKSHGGRLSASSFRNVITRRLSTLVHFAFLNLTRFLRWLGRRRHGGLLWRPWPGGIDHTARLYPQSQNCRAVSRLTVHHGELHALVSRSGWRQV